MVAHTKLDLADFTSNKTIDDPSGMKIIIGINNAATQEVELGFGSSKRKENRPAAITTYFLQVPEEQLSGFLEKMPTARDMMLENGILTLAQDNSYAGMPPGSGLEQAFSELKSYGINFSESTKKTAREFARNSNGVSGGIAIT